MKRPWEKPQYKEIPLGAEVTAYLAQAKSTPKL